MRQRASNSVEIELQRTGGVFRPEYLEALGKPFQNAVEIALVTYKMIKYKYSSGPCC